MFPRDLLISTKRNMGIKDSKRPEMKSRKAKKDCMPCGSGVGEIQPEEPPYLPYPFMGGGVWCTQEKDLLKLIFLRIGAQTMT